MTLVATILTVLLWLVLGLLLGLLGVVALLLLVPLGLRAAGELGDERTAGSVHLTWGLGLLGVRLSHPAGGALQLLGFEVFRFPLTRADRKTRPARQQRHTAKKRRRAKQRTGSLQKGRELFALRRFMLRLAARLFGTFDLRGRAGGLVGTGDPVDTVALRSALLELDRRVEGLQLCFEYDFVDEVVEVWADVRGRVWLAHAIVALVPFVFKRDAWRLLKAVRA